MFFNSVLKVIILCYVLCFHETDYLNRLKVSKCFRTRFVTECCSLNCRSDTLFLQNCRTATGVKLIQVQIIVYHLSLFTVVIVIYQKSVFSSQAQVFLLTKCSNKFSFDKQYADVSTDACQLTFIS